MKQLAVAVLSFALLTPVPAEAIFGSECRSLKKRTQANQIKYEKAWDSYQTTKAQFINSKPDTLDIYTNNNPILPRYIVVGEIQQTIISDFIKYPQCWSKNENINWKTEGKRLQSLLKKPTPGTITMSEHFPKIWNYSNSLK